jgi:hypothetical protein
VEKFLATTTLTNFGRGKITENLSTDTYYIHWGTGTTSADSADINLQLPGTEDRSVATVTRITTDISNDTLQIVGTITCNSTNKAITEAGLFDTLTGDTLWLRCVFSAINVTSGDQIEFTFKIQFA